MDTIKRIILFVLLIVGTSYGTELRKVFVTDEVSNVTAKVNADGQLHVVMGNKIDTNNSTTTVLDPGGVNVFTGTSTDIMFFAEIGINVFASHASATDGLSVQFSSDGTNWDHTDVFTIPAATGKTMSFQPVAQFFRVVYTNGGTLQTAFRLQVLLHKAYIKSSSHRTKDNISGEDDAELVKAVITGENPGGTFVNFQSTTAGNFKVSMEELESGISSNSNSQLNITQFDSSGNELFNTAATKGFVTITNGTNNAAVDADSNLAITDNSNGLAIAKGDVTGTTFIHKFGDAPDFDIADGFVTVWDGADDGVANAMQYTYSTTADIDTLSSSNNGDTQDIEIQGLDTDYAAVTQTITLTGQTEASLTTSLIRVFRMVNVGSTDIAGIVYCYVDDVSVGGVPALATDIRAIIEGEKNQTLMAIYTIPAGKTGFMRDLYVAAGGAKKTSLHEVHLEVRPFGQVFQTKFITGLAIAGTSYIRHVYQDPEPLLEKTDIEMHVNTDEDIASISAGFDLVLVDN